MITKTIHQRYSIAGCVSKVLAESRYYSRVQLILWSCPLSVLYSTYHIKRSHGCVPPAPIDNVLAWRTHESKAYGVACSSKLQLHILLPLYLSYQQASPKHGVHHHDPIYPEWVITAFFSQYLIILSSQHTVFNNTPYSHCPMVPVPHEKLELQFHILYIYTYIFKYNSNGLCVQPENEETRVVRRVIGRNHLTRSTHRRKACFTSRDVIKNVGILFFLSLSSSFFAFALDNINRLRRGLRNTAMQKYHVFIVFYFEKFDVIKKPKKTGKQKKTEKKTNM